MSDDVPRPLTYNADLFGSLPEGSDGCIVARMCADQSKALKALTEGWYGAFAPAGNRLRRRLISPDDATFWGAWWELAAARFFADRGCAVEIEPVVEGKTPDLSIAWSDSEAFVEVINVNPSAETRAEEVRLRRLSDRLKTLVALDRGYLSIVMLDLLKQEPTDDEVKLLAGALGHWLNRRPTKPYWHDEAPLRCHAMFVAQPRAVIDVGPSPRAIDDAARVQDRIGKKLARYGELKDHAEPLVLFVAFDHWTLTIQSVIDAMLGGELIAVDLAASTAEDSRHSGEGALVIGGPRGYEASRTVAGAVATSLHGLSDAPPCCSLDVRYVHNPDSERPLPNGWLDPHPEYQVHGDRVSWVGQNAEAIAVLRP